MNNTLRRYKLPPVKHRGWAVIVIGMDGYFSVVSDLGNFAFFWTNTGEKDFRKFLIGLEPDYMAGKLGKKERFFNGKKTVEAIKTVVEDLTAAEATGFDSEWESNALSGLGSSPDEPDFLLWLNSTEIERAYDIAVYDEKNTADGFVKHILPRFKEVLKSELSQEAKTPPKLTDGHRLNFETLKMAAADDNLALLSCLDAQTNEPRAVIVAVEGLDVHGNVRMAPLAKMFDGDPYEEVRPPRPVLDS